MRLTDLTDEELALRARAEPHAAFEVLYGRHQGPLYNFLLRQGSPPGRVDDLFQTTFIKAFRALSSFREEARFRSWLYAIAVNVVADDRRAAHRRGPEAELHESIPAPEPRASETPEGIEMLDRVKGVLDDLQPNHRLLFILVRFQGLSIAEAAEVVGMTPPAAKVTLFRTQKLVGERLASAREKIS
jgi:RNA polymerase sigma-70 factor (ECF subfamily)